MGSCSSSKGVSDPTARQHAPTSAPFPNVGRDFGATGGKRLGGDSAEATAGVDTVSSTEIIRRKAAEAAERRQVGTPGISKARALGLRERQQKDELSAG